MRPLTSEEVLGAVQGNQEGFHLGNYYSSTCPDYNAVRIQETNLKTEVNLQSIMDSPMIFILEWIDFFNQIFRLLSTWPGFKLIVVFQVPT